MKIHRVAEDTLVPTTTTGKIGTYSSRHPTHFLGIRVRGEAKTLSAYRFYTKIVLRYENIMPKKLQDAG